MEKEIQELQNQYQTLMTKAHAWQEAHEGVDTLIPQEDLNNYIQLTDDATALKGVIDEKMTAYRTQQDQLNELHARVAENKAWGAENAFQMVHKSTRTEPVRPPAQEQGQGQRLPSTQPPLILPNISRDEIHKSMGGYYAQPGNPLSHVRGIGLDKTMNDLKAMGLEYMSDYIAPGYAFKQWMLSGGDAMYREDIPGMTEFKNLQLDSDVQGGFLAMPEVMSNQVIKDMDNETFMRQLSTVHTVGRGQSLGAASLDADIIDPTWTAEIRTGTEDDIPHFGKRQLTPKPAAIRTLISNTMLDAPGINIEMYWLGRQSYKFAIVLENATLTGDGGEQMPLGVFVRSDQGISRSRDVASGASQGITAEALIHCQHFIKTSYWRNAVWILHRDFLRRIRELKTTDGGFVWAAGVGNGLGGIVEGIPPTILGHRYFISEYAPSTNTDGQYCLIFGDFKMGYWIVESLRMQTQRLSERYAEQNQTGFIGRMEADGMPVLQEAFARMQLGTAVS